MSSKLSLLRSPLVRTPVLATTALYLVIGVFSAHSSLLEGLAHWSGDEAPSSIVAASKVDEEETNSANNGITEKCVHFKALLL